MDRNPRWFCCTLLSAFVLSGCASKPVEPLIDPIKAAQDARCAEVTAHRENCGFQGDVMLVITTTQLPTYDKKDKLNPRVFTGTCEVETIKPSDPNFKPDVKPCPATRVEVANPNILGEKVRSATVEGEKFFVGGLPKAQYNVVAISDTFKTQAEIRDIPSGARLKIKIQILAK